MCCVKKKDSSLSKVDMPGKLCGLEVQAHDKEEEKMRKIRVFTGTRR